jgi:7,8-dihydropterin-6-yl-methyl-4-(beta-D-ribofuranosyl)aminobenzene 5'-phosphate synthase
MNRIFLSIALLILIGGEGISQIKSSVLSQSEIDEFTAAIKADTLLARWFADVPNPLTVYERYKKDLQTSDSLWRQDQAHTKPFADLGSTRRFEMLPLIDWFADNDSLIGEAGVSYLIRTDDATILLDVGANDASTDPSPLLKNMERLGVRIEDIDVVVISHPHGDHLGGDVWQQKKSFSLTTHQIPLGGKKVFVPIPMTYPGLEPVCSRQPVKIAKGVATIGLVDCPLFFGHTVEQAIAVNVESRGIVLISGCGHQTIPKLIQRASRLFREPLYGMLGGLHLPFTVGRNIPPYLHYFITGRLPWKPLTRDDVADLAALVRQNGVRIVGISGHDSCDSTIAVFKEAFGKSYKDIAVGKRITVE